MAGGGVGDRVIVVRGHGAAHAHCTDDAAVDDDGDAALADTNS